MENYFAKFPTLDYDGYTVCDLTRRVKISEETQNILTLYYSYVVKDGTRADIISNAYYEDPTLDWLLWLTNKIVDPYYQWNLSYDDFNSYLIEKYGSIENSIKRIAFYRNNWYDDDSVLTPAFYDNNLIDAWKKYYAPVFGTNTKILEWRRREEDWTMETNKIFKLTVNTANFAVGELVDVTDSDVIRVGGGEITNISNDYILIKNIDGAFANGNLVTGETSGANTTINDVSLVYEAISEDEGVFWSPVTYFDIENEKNVYNSQIQIIDSSHVPTISEQLITLLKQ